MEIKYNEQGLVPVVVTDMATKQVLMLAYMNQEAVKLTLETKLAHYYSRSKQGIWLKGETSGNFQEVQGLYPDCDQDALLLEVNQRGVACHTESYSCFNNPSSKDTLSQLYKTILKRQKNPAEGSYTAYLFREGRDKILKKVGEESAEVIIAASKNKDELIYESCDLLYHLFVLWVNEGITLGDIFAELDKRTKLEKAKSC